jgi:putative phosphonate transport system ATP-binding protein
MSERQTPEQTVAEVLLHAQSLTRGLTLPRIAVMQCGRLVETGLADQVLDDPQPPYTQLPVSSVLQA